MRTNNPENKQLLRKKALLCKSLVERYEYVFMTRIKKCFDRLYWSERIQQYIPDSKDLTPIYVTGVVKNLSKELRLFYVKKAEKKVREKLQSIKNQAQTFEGLLTVSKFLKKEQNPEQNYEKQFYLQTINSMSEARKKLALMRQCQKQNRQLGKRNKENTY